MTKFKRYTLSEVNSNRFYQLPKFLFKGEFKRGLSTDSKVLYALLRNRHDASLKNNWINENGEVYIIFKREEMCDMLGYGKDKIIKLCNELKNIGLIEEERQGLNLPNLIFLTYIEIDDNLYEKQHNILEVGKSEVRKSENQKSESRKTRSLDVGNSEPNITNNNKTNISDIKSINQSDIDESNMEQPAEGIKEDGLIDISTAKEIFKTNIEYDIIVHNSPFDKDLLDNIVDITADVLCSTAPTEKINGTSISRIAVTNQLLKLRESHIEYVIDSFKDSENEIKNIRGYIITCLYNAPNTINIYYDNQIK